MAVPLLTRRTALSGLVLLAAGGAVGYVVAHDSDAAGGKGAAGAANGYGPPEAAGAQPLAAVADIPAGGGVVAGGVVVTRDDAGEVHAFSATCTHQGCTVSGVEDGVISCPCHGSQFDAATGDVVRGPATSGLPAIAVTVEGGEVVRS